MYNECRHIMPSGKKCKSPALRDKLYCYHHANLHRLSNPASRAATELPVPEIEDARGIQIALTQVLGALNSPYMDTRRAGLLLYGLNLAATLSSRVDVPSPSQSVREVCNEDSGDVLLAPLVVTCEPPEDCCSCPNWENCEKPYRADEDEFEDDDDESEHD